MKFGLHVSIAGGVVNAPVNAAQVGAETFQMFTRSPRGGQAPFLDKEMVALFKANCTKLGYNDFYVHTPYYINLASANPKIADDSARVIREDLERADLLGATALMTHLGSAKDFTREVALQKTVLGLKKVLAGYNGKTWFLIELSAGSGQIIGSRFEEVAWLVKQLSARDRKHLGICLDTAHAFASGYDLRDDKSVKKVLSEFDRILGLKNLKLIHANDSLAPFASNVDRHWHIGQGKIGLAGFTALVADSRLKNIDLILETPKKQAGDDIKNLKTLQRLRSKI